MPPLHPRITAVQVRSPYMFTLTFTDGSEAAVDLGRWIRDSTGMFAALQNPSVLFQVTVDRATGTNVCLNRADVDSDVLFETAQRTRYQSVTL